MALVVDVRLQGGLQGKAAVAEAVDRDTEVLSDWELGVKRAAEVV